MTKSSVIPLGLLAFVLLCFVVQQSDAACGSTYATTVTPPHPNDATNKTQVTIINNIKFHHC